MAVLGRLIEALADAFIKSTVENGSAPFKVAWYKSDTTESIHYLKDDAVGMGMTYDPAAESLDIRRGVARTPACPAQLNKTDDILTMFSSLYTAAKNSSAPVHTRVLSRYDKSATSIKESGLWIGIGQVPWATAYSTWYHQYIAYPVQALTAAILLEEYTITDRGIYLTISEDLQRQTTIYKTATDSSGDPLLNPAHILSLATRPQTPR